MKNVVRIALVGILSLVGAGLAHADALHGFCTSPTPSCSDNGSITPVASSNPTFGFWDASGPVTGVDLLAFLVPTDTTKIANFTVNVTNGNVSSATASLQPGVWSSGQLDSFLGLSATPTNPIGAYVPDPLGVNPSVTGYWVYTANLGSETVNAQANELSGPLFTLSNLPLGGFANGTFILDFLTPPGDGTIGTPNSAALEVTPGPGPSPVPEPNALLLFGSGLFGLVGIARRRLFARSA